ncbi:MAG: LUD domain-containing protein [Flavobacteriaceae bacterium]|nr:LUD domain-containing protein [Flavobacteriaceae bacterium]
MKFLKKIFKNKITPSEVEIEDQNLDLSLDDCFVHNFIKSGGKFLYCENNQDVTVNLEHIFNENDWDAISVTDHDLLKYSKTLNVNTSNHLNNDLPFFTKCEALIAENGSLLFSENQLKNKKLASITNNLIVYATASQIVKTTDDSLTCISLKYKSNIPSNISSIKSYGKQIDEEDFLNSGTNNSKNLYLLLLEDL